MQGEININITLQNFIRYVVLDISFENIKILFNISYR